MCVMEVHQHQHAATMVQACAHNTRTILGDIEMLEAVLRGRGGDANQVCHSALEQAAIDLAAAYDTFMGAFEAAVRAEGYHPRTPEGQPGEAEREARRAAAYETR